MAVMSFSYFLKIFNNLVKMDRNYKIIKTEIKSFRSEDQSVLQEQLKIYNSALEYFEKNGYNKKSYEEKFDVAVSKINIYINLIGVYFNCKLNNGEIYFDKNLRKDVVLNLDEEYLNRVKLPGNKLRWSQQLRCRLDMGLTEEPIVYLPAMYLAKQDSIKKIKDLLKDIKFIDKIDDNQEVKAKDITIEKLNKLSKLNELFQKEELPSYDNLIYEYFSSLYEIPYYRESEQPKADTSNYTRKFFTDIEHLNELVPLFYTPNETNEGTANPPKDSDTAKKLKAEKDQQAKERHRKIINQLCKHVDLAKFFYIYRSYYIWKANQYNKDGSINPNAKICNINNLDFNKSNLESQPILHMIIYGRSYKVEDRRSTSNTEKDTATAENTLQKEDISLGTLAGLSNAHGEYFDELYTLYYINSTIDYKDAIFMNIFWRSMTLSEYQLMTSSYCTRLHRELYDATDVLIRNSYDSDSRNIPMPPLPLKILQETCKMIANEYLSRKFFLSQLPNLSPGIVPMTFLYNSHLEKKLELLNRLREVVEDAISGAWQPRQEDIDELAMAIVNNTYGFLTYFKKIIKNTRDIFPSNEKLLKEIDEKGNKLTEDDYKILYQFIYGSTEPTDRQKIEAAKNIHSLLPFLVDYTYFFPPTVDNPECKIQMWVYYACIGLYMLSTILTQENIKNHSLELVRKTFDSTEAKYQRIDKFTLTDLVKSKISTKPFYQLLYPYEGNSSYYEKYHFLFDFDLLNILDCNQRAISPLRLNSSKDSKLTQLQNGIALLNSMAVYTLLTSCSLLYDFFPILPDSLRNNILDSLTEINKFTHEDRLFLNNYLKKQYFPDDTESRVGEYYRTNDNADKFHVARVVKYTCHLR